MNNRTRRNNRRGDDRRGVVAVEFAVIAPVLLALMMGVIEVNRAYETQTLLETAAREGARFASIDRDGMVPDGMTGNEKLIADVKTFLESNGLPRDQINVAVKDAENPELDFDIDDPNNDLRLFEVQVSIDFSATSYTAIDAGGDFQLQAGVTFRNGRATIAN